MGWLRKRVRIGWLALGRNCAGDAQQEHWKEMVNSMGISVQKWHDLLPPDE